MSNKSLLNPLPIKSVFTAKTSVFSPEAEFENLLHSLHRYSTPLSSLIMPSPNTTASSTHKDHSSQEEFKEFTKLSLHVFSFPSSFYYSLH
jgi:hypothetical protein